MAITTSMNGSFKEANSCIIAYIKMMTSALQDFNRVTHAYTRKICICLIKQMKWLETRASHYTYRPCTETVGAWRMREIVLIKNPEQHTCGSRSHKANRQDFSCDTPLRSVKETRSVCPGFSRFFHHLSG